MKTSSDYVGGYSSSGSSGLKTMGWTYQNSVTFAPNVTSVAVSCEVTDGQAAGIYEFNRIYWTSQGGGGGVRTATPNGEKSTVTVRPK